MQAALFLVIVLHGSHAFGASPSPSSGVPASSSSAASSAATPTSISATIPPTPPGADTSTSISSAVGDYIQHAKDEHDAQFTNGAAVFGVSSDESSAEWSDDDFIPHDVGIGNGGPTEHVLTNGHLVYQTANPVLSSTECEYWIQTAREAIAAGRAAEAAASDEPRERSRFSDRTNSELGEARLSSLPPDAVAKLRQLLQTRLYPVLESRYGITDLTVYDGLILGSIAPARAQPVHRDASLVTLNIALSPKDGFTDGGTYVEGLESGMPLLVDQGVALCHSSGVMHAGNGIQSGERWQMVLFCLARAEPQVARRCHAAGLDGIADGDLDGAMAAFDAGLTAAPRDHLLHMGRGQVHDARGNGKGAFSCLDVAAECYPLSYKAGIAMGKMHLAARRPRAALRRLDTVLSNIADADLRDGAWMPLKAAAWDARVTAARCAMLCAEYEATKYGPRNFSKGRLPVAIDRLHASIKAAPQDDRLRGLLARAEELLQEAKQT
mmetsp:Transcript_34471/g.75444  ORF Transcript_34471/g.75444 Transcript_34471/m.75444 type:complete len:496 (-) Transcript_34471:137-1624(-)